MVGREFWFGQLVPPPPPSSLECREESTRGALPAVREPLAPSVPPKPQINTKVDIYTPSLCARCVFISFISFVVVKKGNDATAQHRLLLLLLLLLLLATTHMST